MSNGLADASFFPTAKELSTGLRWFKDHPVLAAAAATAVSVITYLNTTDALAATDVPSDDDVEDDERDCSMANEQLDSSEAMYYYSSTSSSQNGRRPDDERGGGSDEKLAAAVSWCDEHGGSLTQVFEHLRLVGEQSEESDDEPARGRRADDLQLHSGVPPEPRICDSRRPAVAVPRPVGSGIRKSSTLQSIRTGVCSPDAMGAQHRVQTLRDDESHGASSSSPGEIDVQTESPQWGWYVAITPPQDHVHTHLPRGALLPPQYRPQPPQYPGIARPSYVSNGPMSSLRRTASGRIS